LCFWHLDYVAVNFSQVSAVISGKRMNKRCKEKRSKFNKNSSKYADEIDSSEEKTSGSLPHSRERVDLRP
jgi:hypothetical protein